MYKWIPSCSYRYCQPILSHVVFIYLIIIWIILEFFGYFLSAEILEFYVQCNLSIPNLAYSEILLNPNKLFGPKVFYHL